MIKKHLSLLLGAAMIVSNSVMMVQADDVPQPGALSFSASVASLNNIANVFVPIMSYYTVENKDINIDYSTSGWFYKLEVDKIHIDKVDFGDQKSVQYLPDTNTIRVLFSGVNVNLDVDGSVKALWFIPFGMSHANITGASVQMDFGITTSDNVHW